MKRTLFLLTLLISYSAHCQIEETTSQLVCKSVDDFTDKVSYRTNETIVLYKDDGDMKTEGMVCMLFLDEKKGKIIPSTFYVRVLGLSSACVDEGSTLDIIFENGEKTQLVNWKDFDCEGKNYFNLKGKEDLFKNNRLKAIKYTNKRNYESMVVKTNMDENGSSYLVNTLLELDKINNGEMNLNICAE